MEKLTNIYNENKEVKIFSLINQLLDNLQIFKKRELIIFKNAFNYYENFQLYKLEDIATLIDVTRERTRQLRNKIFKELSKTFNFLKVFEPDFKTQYNIDIDDNIITIKEEIVNRINKTENTNFNKSFILKILSVTKKETHYFVGDEENIVFGNLFI